MLWLERLLDFVIPNSSEGDRLCTGWSNRHRAATTEAALARAVKHAHRDHISSGTYQRPGHNVLTWNHVTVRSLSAGRTYLCAVEVGGVEVVNRWEIQDEILTSPGGRQFQLFTKPDGAVDE